MGLFDTALSMLNTVNGQNGDTRTALIQAAISMLSNSSNGQSGLQGLISAFHNAGLADIVNSWVGTGQNLPISPAQIQQALGGSHLSELAQATGISHESAAGHLADLLPGIIDQLTPHGQIPEAGSINPAQMLQQFSSLFGNSN
ncbi:MAG: DUF937 domain-containing protein [Burkholderiales bacterium]|nr:DUF937 domain-containing protein [Burkholderiales bacterium]